jgi:uncharacterized membrane protein YdjX (TVP38/TMEM64 family)
MLVAGGFLLKTSEFGEIIDKNWIDNYVSSNGLEGQLIFILVASLLVTIGFPRQIISFLSGYAFGLNLGTIIAVVACGIGCAIAFFFARFIGREWVTSKFPNRLAKADKFFSANTFATTLLIRFMPAGSNIVTNLVAGVSRARAFVFIAGSMLGYIPQTIIFALLGSGFQIDIEFRITLGVMLFLASILLGLFLYRRYKRLSIG